VKVFRNPQRVAIQENFNRAVALSTRPWVKMLHADDALLPGAISAFERMIRAVPHARFHGFLAEIIDGAGRSTRRQRTFIESGEPVHMAGRAAIRAKLRQQARFREPSCNLYFKEAWREVGGYETKYRFMADIHFNIKLMSRVPTVLWSEHLVQLRRHAYSDGARLPASLAMRELTALTEEMLGYLGADADYSDRSAAIGWRAYRLIELAAMRLKVGRMEVIHLLWEHGASLLDPMGALYAARLLRNRLCFGDVQQRFDSSAMAPALMGQPITSFAGDVLQ
jgi:muconolactone delta-isomerase